MCFLSRTITTRSSWLVMRSLCFFFLLLLRLVLTQVKISSLKPDEIAIVQFDSRPLDNYWLAAAKWNHAYCEKHGHLFLYYQSDEDCHYGKEKLASAWCKVKAMINAQEDYPGVQVFVYMDSDAVVDRQFADESLNHLLAIMQNRLSWKPEEKPMVFNQDGPCWWCTFIISIGYTMCLNAGTVVWYRHAESHRVLWQWWNSTMDSYETNPIKRKFRLKWPWEQDRQMAIYNRSKEVIQIASQPDRIFMQGRAGVVNGWCLSHLPEARCFISHYCANGKSKQIMRNRYQTTESEEDNEHIGFKINKLHFDPL